MSKTKAKVSASEAVDNLNTLNKYLIETFCEFNDQNEPKAIKQNGFFPLYSFLMNESRLKKLKEKIILENPSYFIDNNKWFKKTSLVNYLSQKLENENFSLSIKNIMRNPNTISLYMEHLARKDEGFDVVLSLLKREFIKYIKEEYLKIKDVDGLLNKKLKSVLNTLNFQKRERDTIIFLSILGTHPNRVQFFNNVNQDIPSVNDSHRVGVVSYYLNVGIESYARSLKERYDDIIHHYVIHYKYDDLLDKSPWYCWISLTKYYIDFLLHSRKSAFVVRYFEQIDSKEKLKLDEFNLSKEKLKSVDNLFVKQKSGNIFIYGVAGTGKTEYCKSLGLRYNRKCMFLNVSKLTSEDSFSKLKFLESGMIVQYPNRAKSIIVIDEAEDILTTRSMWGRASVQNKSRALLNKILEDENFIKIFIVNDKGGLELSTIRRFDCIIHFDKLGSKAKKKMWKKQVMVNGLNESIGDEEVSFLVENYDTSVALITKVLKKIKKTGFEDKEEIMGFLKEFLDSYTFLVTGKKRNPVNITTSYNLKYLNTDHCISSLVEDMKSYLYKKENDQLTPDVQGVCGLLVGPPGAGKTELVKHLSKTLGKELMKKKCL